MALLGRILIIVLALFVASLVAGAVVATAVLLPDFSDLALLPLDDNTTGIILAFGAIFLSGFALLPALVLVLVSEALGIRSALFYAAAGALAGFVLYWSFGGWEPGALTVNGFARREAEIMSGAGIMAGLVYWMIAGRNAGRAVRPGSGPLRPGT
jgi:hypothetical protein